METNTSTMIAWYYVGVMVLLFAGQNFLMKTAHKDGVARVTAQYEQKLKEAGMPAAAKVVAEAAPAPTPAAPPAAAISATPKAIVASPATNPEPASATAKASDAAALKTLAASPAEKPKASASSKRLPAVPVKVAFRSEPFKKGKVVLVTNTSKQERAYTLNVTRPSTGESETFKVKVPPAAETRFAGEGVWAFEEGDQLQIALAGHAPTSVAIP